MKKIASALIATALNSALVVNGMAGEASNCSCVSTPAATNAVVGNIVQSSGDVLYSAAGGYIKAKPGATLVVGSQISVGDGASARISVGSTCKLNIPANTEVSILQSKAGTKGVCVNVASLTNPAPGTVQEGSSTQAGAAAGTFALIGVGVVAVAVGAALADGAASP